jgi:hypothetical protein
MIGRLKTKSGAVGKTVVKAQRALLATRLILGGLVWLAMSLGMWLSLFYLDNLVQLPSGLRLALSLAAAGVMLFTLWKYLVMPLLRRYEQERIALYLEEKFAVPENFLINALQFESRVLANDEQPFAQRTINSGLMRVSRAPLRELWQLNKMTILVVVSLVLAGFWGFYLTQRGVFASNAFARFVRPLSDVPPVGIAALQVTPGEDIAIAEGDDVQVSVKVKGHDGDAELETLPKIVWQERVTYLQPEAVDADETVMRIDTRWRNTYEYTFTKVKRSFCFRVMAGGTYSRSIRVMVNAAPQIQESQFHIRAPVYTGGSLRSVLGPPEPLAGLKDSIVVVDLGLDKPADTLWWKSSGKSIAFEEKEGRWRAKTKIEQDGTYEIAMRPSQYSRRITVARGAIALQQDLAPQVEFATTQRNRALSPGQLLKLNLQASDDYGLSEIYVNVRPVRSLGQTETVKRWTYEGPPGKSGPVEETLVLPIDASKYKPGENFILEAYCKDYCPEVNTGRSQPIILQIKSLEELTLAQDDPRSDAFGVLEDAIEAQQAALGVTKNLSAVLEDVLVKGRAESENRKALGRNTGAMDEKQDKVGWHLGRAEQVAPNPKPPFVKKMKALRDNEHKRTMEKIRELRQASSLRRMDVRRDLQSVEKLQEYILDQLIALKGEVAGPEKSEERKVIEQMLAEEDGALGVGLEQALKEMVKELDEFTNQQKHIMEERRMLMNQPPEDFSEADEATLEELALEQSRLAEMLASAVNDFTNLDLLDFGDAGMVDTMKSIYEQAEDLVDSAEEAADQRQARVDAYRLETEMVEMAEEIMINCEATLGFYDGIQFIAEIAEDEQLVAPLAELPSELEDLVGDLITSEEEMQEEVEDIGHYMNSLDHTAGPVSDGTIASNSAKGKTGDQKPEDNVISGRSGAGRSGMSDGQMVEPVAKDLHDNEYGLRERMSNTPLEGGQVQDQDVGAQTGGTGMGKTTDGATMFGAGGRLPPKVLDMMKAAALKQQNVRHRAQQLVPKLRKHNLSTDQLSDSIQAMGQVEQSMQNLDGEGIRRSYHQALDSLKKSHQAIGNEVAVQYLRERSITKRMENVLSTKQQHQFRDYQHMIGAYFEALAEGEEKESK